MPLVDSLFTQYQGLNPGLTANQGGALTKLNDSVSNLPNFGGAGAAGINNLFSSAGSAPQVGMLNNAYSTLQGNLGATASGANLDPYSTPGFGDALKTTMDDITNRTKGVYAASGRDPSGAGSFAQSLGRGLTQGVAPTIAGQYNTNYGNMVNANNSLFAGANGTASAINNLRSGDTSTLLAALQGAGSVPGLYSAPAVAQLGAANAQYQQPYQNLAQLLQPSVALAGLGSNSSGTGNSVQTSTPSLLSTIGTGISGIGALAGMGGGGAIGPTSVGGAELAGGSGLGSIMAMLGMSDERLKTDAAPVGKLNDGQTVWKYRYKGDPVERIGLMAQEVKRHVPEAVGRHSSGFLMVDYGKATRRARVGALQEAA